MIRIGVIRYPDWPIIAAGYGPTDCVAIIDKTRIYSSSLAARDYQVIPGMPVARALALCPTLQLHPINRAREHEQFAVIAEHCTILTPFVQILHPGVLQLTGSQLPQQSNDDSEFWILLFAALADALKAIEPPVSYPDAVTPYLIGVADTVYGALVAAHKSPKNSQLHSVAAGETRRFLHTQAIDMLALLPLVHHGLPAKGELQQLIYDCKEVGVFTCGALLALPRTTVIDRFGTIAQPVLNALSAEVAPTSSAVFIPNQRRFVIEFATALTDLSAVAFAARRTFDKGLAVLHDTGLACYQAGLSIVTENDERSERSWQAREYFTAALLQERLRWQLEGWRAGTNGPAPSAGVTQIIFIIERTVSSRQQPTLLYDATDNARTALLDTAVSRIDGLLGQGAVTQPYRAAGRHPAQWFDTRPWSRKRHITARPLPVFANQLPSPAPATLYPSPRPIEVHAANGTPVVVTGRGIILDAPHMMRFSAQSWDVITAWAGPWLANERWWETEKRRAARFQFVTESGLAYLVAQSNSRWFAEALYD
ncbi:MAG: hypothetical protein WD360_00860 [Nitriliruptoraceae bacterium]